MRTLVLTAAASALFASAMTLAITQPALVAKWGPQIASGAEHIHPESLSRLPPVDRETFDADGQRIYDLIAKAYGGRKLSGPAAASLYSPSVAEPVHMLNEYLRKQGVLGPRFTELAILVTARELDQQYEWSAHALAGARVGLEQPIIDLVRHKKPPVGLAEKDTLIIRFAQQLLREKRLSPALFADSVRLFGEKGTIELATLIGDYVLAGYLLEVVDQQLPPDLQPTLPVLSAK